MNNDFTEETHDQTSEVKNESSTEDRKSTLKKEKVKTWMENSTLKLRFFFRYMNTNGDILSLLNRHCCE